MTLDNAKLIVRDYRYCNEDATGTWNCYACNVAKFLRPHCTCKRINEEAKLITDQWEDLTWLPEISTKVTTTAVTDGYTYDCPTYKYQCTSCGEFYHSDKRGSYCPNCGEKFRED